MSSVILEGSLHQDLGIAIDGGIIPAGQRVYSPWYDDAAWVRHLLIMTQADQDCEYTIYRRMKDGTMDWGSTLITKDPPKASNSWGTTIFSALRDWQMPPGDSFRFSIKNLGTAPTTFARLRVQLMGL